MNESLMGNELVPPCVKEGKKRERKKRIEKERKEGRKGRGRRTEKELLRREGKSLRGFECVCIEVHVNLSLCLPACLCMHVGGYVSR